MKKHWKIQLLACTFAVAVLTTAGTLFAGKAENKSVSEANAQFYSALNTMFKGDAKQMEQVWSHADDVTYMGPMGGMQVGWSQVLPIWREQAAARLGGEVQPKKIRIHAGREVAVVCCYEMGQNIVDGKLQKVSIRATNVFRKEQGQWKMIGHHTDLLPFLEN
jgi:ketosteroid isomerase-like protein